MDNKHLHWKKHNIYILIILFLSLFISVYPAGMLAASAASINDFGTFGLETYLNHAQSSGIDWRLLCAMDITEGYNIRWPDASLLRIRTMLLLGDNDDQRLRAYGGDDGYVTAVMNNKARLSYVNSIITENEFPLKIDITFEDTFGASRTYGGERPHEGVDIICDAGTPIYSVCSGIVEKKGWLQLGGWRLGIRGEDGIYYYYAHLSQYAGGVEPGMWVNKGQLIGYVGSTGYGPEGTDNIMIPHLHFGMYENDIAVNPYPFLKIWNQR